MRMIFFERRLARAQRLDRGEILLPEMRITFDDPEELMRALTVKRVDLMAAILKQPAGLSELAQTLNRNRAAVDRDVKVLASLGLLKTVWQVNLGHGRRKIIQSLASRYELVAVIWVANLYWLFAWYFRAFVN
jgi:predicted transcriptional regulator